MLAERDGEGKEARLQPCVRGPKAFRRDAHPSVTTPPLHINQSIPPNPSPDNNPRPTPSEENTRYPAPPPPFSSRKKFFLKKSREKFGSLDFMKYLCAVFQFKMRVHGKSTISFSDMTSSREKIFGNRQEGLIFLEKIPVYPWFTTKFQNLRVEFQSLLPGVQSLLPGKQSLLPGEQSLLPGRQSLLPGRQSLLPGKQSLLPGKQSLLPGRQSLLPGVQSLLPGRQSLLPGERDSKSNYKPGKSASIYLQRTENKVTRLLNQKGENYA
jgi:hypothetical protein